MCMDCHGRVVSASDSCSGGRGFMTWNLARCSCCISLSLRTNAGVVSSIRPRPVPSASIPIFELIILSSDYIYISWEASLNKSGINILTHLAKRILTWHVVTCFDCVYRTPLGEFWGSHRDECEVGRLMGYCAVLSGRHWWIFRRNYCPHHQDRTRYCIVQVFIYFTSP
jgi:hypothetical protein